MSETAITQAVERAESKVPVSIGHRGLSLQSLDDLWRFSQYVEKSGLAPKGIQTKEAIFVAVQMGLELGLTPMAALQNIAVINGRPSLWGDAQLGVVRATGQLEEFAEWFEADGKRIMRNPDKYTDTATAVCRVKRSGYPVAESSFSVADAKTAGLWGKQGPWVQFPARMLRMRARSFILRDQFGDALRGMLSAEEMQDSPRIVNISSEVVEVRDVKPSKPAPGTTARFAGPKNDDHADDQIPGVEVPPVSAPTPSSKEPTGESTTSAPALSKSQEDLVVFLEETGVGWDDFTDWMVSTSRAKNAKEWSMPLEMPDAACEAILKDEKGLYRLKILHGSKQ